MGKLNGFNGISMVKNNIERGPHFFFGKLVPPQLGRESERQQENKNPSQHDPDVLHLGSKDI